MFVLGVSRSLTGQAWRWRPGAGEWDGGGDDEVARILLARGIAREELARHRLPTIRGFMPDPSVFRDMDAAAHRLADAVAQGERVAVLGDYDVDGATSAALLVRVLRGLGLDPLIYIPDRIEEGYGPSGEALVGLAGQGATLAVTVDCGAQAFDALEAARTAGLDVVVVDHHKCAAALPVAHALVNPNRLDEGEHGAAHGHLAAVGMCFLLAAALYREIRARGALPTSAPDLMGLLDLVALGTVADVAQLRGLNRAFVAQGLKVMAGRTNTGLDALLRAARVHGAPRCRDLGFALGPRINAGGRVGKSDLGVRLLVTENPAEAEAIAAELERLNEERRAVEALVIEAAELALVDCRHRHAALVAGAGWHPGVIGIVAGRLKERLGRPAIVIGIDADGVGKGSGRSIPGVDLGAAVLAAKDSGLLVAGGGHAMAAGLTVRAGDVPALADFLDARLAADVERATADRALTLDGVLTARGVSRDLHEAFEAGGPYGAGWPAPRVVAGPVRLLEARIVGNGHLRLLAVGDDGARLKAVAFRQADAPLGRALLPLSAGTRLWLAGRVQPDDWGDRPGAELHLEDAALADAAGQVDQLGAAA